MIREKFPVCLSWPWFVYPRSEYLLCWLLKCWLSTPASPHSSGNNANWWIDISKWISMFSLISDGEGERDIKGSIKENRFLKDSRTWGDEMGERLGLAAGDQSWKSGDWSRGNNKQEQLLWSPLTVNIRSPGSHSGRGDGPYRSSGRS